MSWQPQIGDPTIMGWITVTFYFLTATLAFITALTQRTIDPTGFRFWGLLAVLLLLLGINKQLDVQSLFTEIGRMAAKRQGWYNKRRSVQLAFVIVFGCIALLTIISI